MQFRLMVLNGSSQESATPPTLLFSLLIFKDMIFSAVMLQNKYKQRFHRQEPEHGRG